MCVGVLAVFVRATVVVFVRMFAFVFVFVFVFFGRNVRDGGERVQGGMKCREEWKGRCRSSKREGRSRGRQGEGGSDSNNDRRRCRGRGRRSKRVERRWSRGRRGQNRARDG